MSACSHRPSVNRAVLIQSVASCVAVILALNFKVMEFPAMVSCVQGRVVSSLKICVDDCSNCGELEVCHN